MLSDERLSTRSPTNSRTDSYQDRSVYKGYQRPQTISEEGETYNEYESTADDADEQPKIDRPPQRSEDQYIAALKYRFPNRSKNDYAYSKPVTPSVPSATAPSSSNFGRATTSIQSTSVQTTDGTLPPRSGAYQSTIRPNSIGTNTTETPNDKTFLRPALRRVNPDQQNTYARRVATDTTTTGTSTVDARPMTSTGTNVRINEPDIQTNKSMSSVFTHQTGTPQPHESIFEKVHSQGGSTSYLGTGTFSQFEQCLRECLERERRQLGAASQITRHDIPAGVSAYDYGYDSVMTSVPNHLLYPNSGHHIIDYPSRSGIPIFPYEKIYRESYPSSYPISGCSTTFASPYRSGRHIIGGEVVSACRVVEDDPAIIHNREQTQAVQNVWNAIQRSQPF